MMSASRSLLGGIRYRKFVRYQLGPDQPPVVRTEVTAGNSAVGGGFDGGAAFYRDRTITGPLGNEHWSYSKRKRKRRSATTFLIKIGSQFHAANNSTMLYRRNSTVRLLSGSAMLLNERHENY